MQASHEELEGQVGGQLEWWRGQLEDLKAQLRGEATRVLELQKKAYNAKMAQEAAVQVGAALSCFVCPYGNRPLLSAPYGSRSLFFFPYVDKVFLVCPCGFAIFYVYSRWGHRVCLPCVGIKSFVSPKQGRHKRLYFHMGVDTKDSSPKRGADKKSLGVTHMVQ